MKKTLKKHQPALFVGVVFVLVLLAYFKQDSIKAFFSKPKTSPSKSSSTGNKKTSTNSKDSILSQGSKGEQVRKLQKLLNDRHRQSAPTLKPYLVEDGVFGAKTESMLKKYTNQTSITLNQLIKKLA